ncbi:uncharacterized protein DFL_003022 [Arthrobotrys flagrans]|uniref:Glucose-methanol-choline oxidoreductase N-terminal domain-containing protein n=1 Tax=Arthrobotrys flagrans TaxID=97331 RepID=A0A437ACL3_ARTFL|nr:hypothetical protein DFL_003022 [Arthrobotrys flagrans]
MRSIVTTTLLQLLLAASTLSTPLHKRVVLSGYEYVVVGSGGGGGPVAARLARLGHEVLLLEAGDDQGVNIVERVPAFHGLSTLDESMRWDFYVNHYSDPVRQARDSKTVYEFRNGTEYIGLSPPAGANMKGILYPRAGTLGGCGSHNALITVAPHDSDWDCIRSITGDNSWAASNMKQYFERLEKVNYDPNSVVGHGTQGWLWVERPDVSLALGDGKIVAQLLASAFAMGQDVLEATFTGLANLAKILLADVNSGLPGRDSREGLFQIPLARRNKARNGPRDFVVETLNARNPDGSKRYKLDVRMNCLVTKIIWDRTGAKPRAVGVEFMDGQALYRADPRSGAAAAGTPGTVTATREVILSAGVFNTPQLLKLSGVGPVAELQSFGIPVVANLPGVGTNLQDRYEVGVTSTVPSDFNLLKGCTFGQGNDPCLKSWSAGETSPYESNGFASAVIKKTAYSTGDPDIFMFSGPVLFTGYYPNYAIDAVKDKKHWTWAILKAHTGNRAGTVNLRSTDPKDTPIINFNYFDTGTASAANRDLKAMVEAVKLARRIDEKASNIGEDFTEKSPGLSVNTDAKIEQFVKDNAWGHHASCTCPIGADSDPNAVLDSKFRVRKVDGLRVVDASVFPKIPGMFIAVPIYMMAEKAADVIHAAAVGGSARYGYGAPQTY